MPIDSGRLFLLIAAALPSHLFVSLNVAIISLAGIHFWMPLLLTAYV